MPYVLRKLPNKDLYKVFNKETGTVYSSGTTKEKAQKQIRLLYMLENQPKKINENTIMSNVNNVQSSTNVGQGIKQNKWIQHVKAYAQKH